MWKGRYKPTIIIKKEDGEWWATNRRWIIIFIMKSNAMVEIIWGREEMFISSVLIVSNLSYYINVNFSYFFI